LTRVDTRLRQAVEAGALPKELLVCGPAGTGKTYGILAALHQIACRYRGLRILVDRQTRVSLTESVLPTYEQEVLAADGMGSLAAGASRRHRAGYVYPTGTEIVLGAWTSRGGSPRPAGTSPTSTRRSSWTRRGGRRSPRGSTAPADRGRWGG
jgi:hypothetical protein